MPLSLVQTIFITSQSKTPALCNSNSPLLSKSLFPATLLTASRYTIKFNCRRSIHASLIESPVLWIGRVCVFYALLKAGLAGSDKNPFVSELNGESKLGESDDFGFSRWLRSIKLNPGEKEAADRRKLVSKWHPTTKGTLRRNYRVPTKLEGRRLLKAITVLLSGDDHFMDATSHKGCQIRRESAHGESVCCNNVRALFDELPTPHVTVEITPFPVGPLKETDYIKAEKLEKVLRSGPYV